jgi:rhamnosyltransferase
MKISIAAVVVLYNPEAGFIENILTYIDHVSKLIIIDNSENPDPDFYTPLLQYRHVERRLNKENTGIAKALNDGIRIAISCGYSWVMTMDQDSFFENDMVLRYFSDFNELNDKDKLAVAGPVTEGKIKPAGFREITEKNSLITSGSLINTAIFKTLNGFDEKLFIDEVDHEYCYRAILAGYSVKQFQHILLSHPLGKEVSVRTILGKRKTKTFHSPVRLYYMVRNCCYIMSVFKRQFPGEIKLKKKDLLVRIKNHLLYGHAKFRLARYMLKGYIHYKTKRFGKL